jgi:2-phospho-L-lactate guanylyltransferase
MNWTALVPLKQAGSRKTRLDGRLSAADRARLGESLARHVIATVARVQEVASVVLLSDAPLAGLDVRWLADGGYGLNHEIGNAVAALGHPPLLIVQGDLPWLSPDDVTEMVAGAVHGASIAPDRHGTGTNALALVGPRGYRFAFGADSFAAHRRTLGAGAAVVHRPGLAFDIDTSADLDEALGAGLRLDPAR